MNPVLIILGFAAGIWLLSLIFFVRKVRSAPPGCEDDHAFYVGEPPCGTNEES